ncbi:MAG: RNA-binding protein [Archaeoglobaceae archaeon]
MKTRTINIGKNGITESLINEIKLQLEKSGELKIRLLKNFERRREKELVVKELAERLKCRIKDVRGFVITIEVV